MGKLNKCIMLCTLILICGIVITGCGCEHEWTPAICTEPATCLKCGETEGEPNGHTWIPATCTNPQTCSVRHETTGDIQSHAFGTPVVTLEPTCAEDGQQTLMCTNCGYTETEVLKRTGKHTVETWKTVTKPTCSEYGAEEGKCVILLPGKLKKMLLDHAKKNGIRSGAIFITRNGKPLNRSNIWAQMKSLCKKAGVKASKVFPLSFS